MKSRKIVSLSRLRFTRPQIAFLAAVSRVVGETRPTPMVVVFLNHKPITVAAGTGGLYRRRRLLSSARAKPSKASSSTVTAMVSAVRRHDVAGSDDEGLPTLSRKTLFLSFSLHAHMCS
ncbi:hypothetical protein L1987_57580 [Smallanthus sonchifolius]|uniref:Uncharacterized protein n=1 Tax=Smallanthus sonchifolius TaxID=185202 RepID=A0ACB9DDP1_9ASTR|nr:hypothetical protein L1987_57580 [Smallanthus sonchifolius]